MNKLTQQTIRLALTGALTLSSAAFAGHMTSSGLYGSPLQNGHPIVQQAKFDRVIVIGDDSQHINVESGERVKFVVGNASFEWLFDTYDDAPSFDLAKIAPNGLLDGQKIIIHVSSNPLYYIG